MLKIWEYLYRNPTTFNPSAGKGTAGKGLLRPKSGFTYGPWMLALQHRKGGKDNYYITKEGVSIRLNYKCYRCFVLNKKEVTFKSPVFTIYCGFEESPIGKHFVRISQGGEGIELKYVRRMHEMIVAGIVDTTFPRDTWYKPFVIDQYGRLGCRVNEQGTVITVTSAGHISVLNPVTGESWLMTQLEYRAYRVSGIITQACIQRTAEQKKRNEYVKQRRRYLKIKDKEAKEMEFRRFVNDNS